MVRSKLNPLGIFAIFFFATTYLFFFFYYIRHQVEVIPSVNNTETILKSSEKVTRIIDGDTFEIEGGIKVRLIGVDTPEMRNKNKIIDCFAQEATQKLKELLNKKEVVLEKDISETDKYGRLLRYVYLGDEMVNRQLVKDGYARIATFPPDIKYSKLFLDDERQARESNLGLWSACK